VAAATATSAGFTPVHRPTQVTQETLTETAVSDEHQAVFFEEVWRRSSILSAKQAAAIPRPRNRGAPRPVRRVYVGLIDLLCQCAGHEAVSVLFRLALFFGRP
jgi:hypothetical protein